MTELDLPKAAASSKEVLETKANTEAEATSGPDEQVQSNLYVTWTRPDGGTFVAPLSNSETYERKEGFTAGKAEVIESLVEWNKANAAKEPPKPKAEAKAEEKPAESS